tara:strand:+ start:12083 stop:12244 length:162 start_codon:yes stop_codon:yes gene_type:complete
MNKFGDYLVISASGILLSTILIDIVEIDIKALYAIGSVLFFGGLAFTLNSKGK